MNKIVAPLMVLIASGVSAGASAQGYLGLGVGQVRVNIDCSGTITCDKTDTATKIFGGYMFTPNWGLEGAYYDQGKLHQTATDATLGSVSADWRGSGYGLFGVAALPLDAWSVFAKLGIVDSKVKLDATSSTAGSASASERHTRYAWGLGGEYLFTKNWVGRLEVEQIGLRFQDEKRHANLWTVGAVYRF